MNKPNKQKLSRRDPKPQTVFVCTVLLLIGFIVCFAARWYTLVYGDTGFDSVMFTLSNGLDGTEGQLVNSYIKGGLVPAKAIREDAVPIDNVIKFAWADEDYEDVQMYMPNQKANEAPTQMDRIEAQVTYTAMMTDTLLEV